MALTSEEADAILAILIGEKHRDRWRRSAEFHARVRMLVALLPDFVAGMAATADEADDVAQKQLAMARLMDPPGFIDPYSERTAELRRRLQQEQS